jgi:D-psicose/D-tagatose/L-ribulose 3-epimerase
LIQATEPDHELAEKRIEECLRGVVEAAEQHGATLVLEPVNHLQASFNNSLSQVMALVERIGSPQLKPMLYTFHINIEEKSMTEPIHRVGPNLGHFHLCETNGAAPGSGHLDYHCVFDALKAIEYTGWVSVKNYRQPWNIGAEVVIQYLRENSLYA